MCNDYKGHILNVNWSMFFFPQNTCLYLVNSTYSKAGLIISINFVENQRKLPYITKNIMKWAGISMDLDKQ